MKILKFTAIGFAAIFVAALLFLVVGVPADFLVDTIRTRFAAETGYQLEIAGGAKIDIWPAPSIIVKDITLLKPGDDAAQNQLTAASARLDMSLASLISGKPKITEFVLVRPVIRVPLLRRANESKAAASAQPSAASTTPRQAPEIGRVVVEDGSVLFMRSADHIQSRVDHIKLVAIITDPDHRLDAKIDAKVGSQSLRIQLKSKTSIDKVEQSLPLELNVEAPGLLQGALSSTANVTSVGTQIKINDLDGTIGKDRFTGWASIDMAGKPRVKVDIDFKRLSLAAITPDFEDTTRPSTLDQPWSDQDIDLDDLNYVDAQVAFSATEFAVSSLRVAPVFVELALADGVLDVSVSNVGLYGGKANGVLTLDVSGAVPRQLVRMNLNGVRALPLLSTLADFRSIDGTLQGKINVRGAGASPRAIMSTLAGTVDVLFNDGQILSVNIAQMVRSLTQNMLEGWQEKKSEKTDLTELSGLFKINAGRATTDNLKLLGPLIRVNGTGTADIAAKTLQFKLDTKLVMSLEGQGGAADPVGFGVPVMVEGKWGAPRIYPDMAGILDNPDAAYAKLRDLGAGLFGNSDGKSSTGSDSFLKGLGNLFDSKGSDRKDSKDSQAPAAGDKQSEPQDTQTNVNDFLKNIFGR